MAGLVRLSRQCDHHPLVFLHIGTPYTADDPCIWIRVGSNLDDRDGYQTDTLSFTHNVKSQLKNEDKTAQQLVERFLAKLGGKVTAVPTSA